ncbi:MAG: aspartate-semialdehyde dehydrogenase [Bacteroidetes Order II. Incertae sedis bacterium]|nr:aspartate-semialdehyde dehydrogenase [Bacteroidetes Order II. bacterium]
MQKYRVGVLGATGAVGQKFVELLDGHPWFEVVALAASERSAGKKYIDAVNWIGATPIPEKIAGQTVVLANPEEVDADFVFSGVDASVALEMELAFAQAGMPVISNTRNYRMEPTVPLLVPEVNPAHLALIDRQTYSKQGGFIVTNPNCSTVGLVLALLPLQQAFGLEAVHVVTMQALSGAGYPGVPSLDILGNVVPHIGGEEAKMETEPLKLFGTLSEEGIRFADFKISASCNRVPVLDGHTESVSVKLKTPADLSAIKAAFETFEDPIGHLGLPSSPTPLIKLFEDERFPQPRRHASLGNGMTVSVGRVRADTLFDVKFTLLVHNTIRGAAGGAILNAELLVNKGYLKHRI